MLLHRKLQKCHNWSTMLIFNGKKLNFHFFNWVFFHGIPIIRYCRQIAAGILFRNGNVSSHSPVYHHKSSPHNPSLLFPWSAGFYLRLTTLWSFPRTKQGFELSLYKIRDCTTWTSPKSFLLNFILFCFRKDQESAVMTRLRVAIIVLLLCVVQISGSAYFITNTEVRPRSHRTRQQIYV